MDAAAASSAAAPSAAAVSVPLKLVYKDAIVRVRADPAALDLAALRALVREAFGAASVTLKYTDPEGDLVTVALDEDVRTALALFAQADGSFATVRFTAAPDARAAFQESVVEPVVRAMEQLVETLDAAKASVKSNSRTHSRSEALRESLAAVRGRIQEIPFERLVKDASSGLKSAAESAAAKAKGAVEDAKKEKIVQDAAEGFKSAAEGFSKFAADVKKDPTVQDVAEGFKTVAGGISEAAKEAVGEVKSKVAPYFAQSDAAVAPAPPAAESGDADREQVAEQQQQEQPAVVAVTLIPAAVPAVPAAAEEATVAVAASEHETKWSEQLAMIREVVPAVDAARAIEHLEAANGDLEVALNALVEEL